MSCWVVPSVAAELWGCTVDAVLSAIRNGHVPTKEDSGWTFVDVAPESPQLAAPKAVRPPTPETYAVVSQAEKMALVYPPDQTQEEREMHGEMMDGDWRKIRRDVAASRRAPLAEAA
jgi:hypothetical protein